MQNYLLEGYFYEDGVYRRRVLHTTQGKMALITDSAFDSSLANVSNPFPIESPFSFSVSIKPRYITYKCDFALSGLVFPNINPVLEYDPLLLSRYYLPIHNTVTCATITGYSTSRWNQYTQTISNPSFVSFTQSGYQIGSSVPYVPPDPDISVYCNLVMNLNATLSDLRLHFAGTTTNGVEAWWEGQLGISFSGSVVMTVSEPDYEDSVYNFYPSYLFTYTLRKNCTSDMSAHGVYSITANGTYSPGFINLSQSPTITL